jgi:hypothetical protein
VIEGVVQALTYPAAAAAVAIAAPAGRASAAQGLAGAAGLLMSMVIAFFSPSIYGAAGATVAFGSVGLLMAVLTAIAAIMYARPVSSSVR